MKKKYCLFDIDGTLLNTNGAGKNALSRAVNEVCEKYFSFEKFSFAGKTDTGIISEVFSYNNIQTNKEKLADNIKTLYFKYLIDNLENNSYKLFIYPNVVEFLEMAKNNENYELALLTGNFSKGAEIKLKFAGLWDFFEWGVFGEISEDRNMLSAKALEIIKSKDATVDTKDIYVIGDTTGDIKCGKFISATTIAYVSDFEPEENLRKENPDYIIYDFKELNKICGF